MNHELLDFMAHENAIKVRNLPVLDIMGHESVCVAMKSQKYIPANSHAYGPNFHTWMKNVSYNSLN